MIILVKDAQGKPRLKVPGYLEVAMEIPEAIAMAHAILNIWQLTGEKDEAAKEDVPVLEQRGSGETPG